MPTKRNILAFIGSYAEAADPGVYACVFDSESGSLTVTDQVSGLYNPTFVAVHKPLLKLYAIAADIGPDGRHQGAAASYHIDPVGGKLAFFNRERTLEEASACHLQLDRSGRCLIVASYHGAGIGLSPILEDGRIGRSSDVHYVHGSSVLPVQSQSRPHSVYMDRSNRFAAVPDLGADRIRLYRLDTAGCRLLPHGGTDTPPGSGPRHFAFHTQLPYGYSINELNSTVTAYAYDEQLGELTWLQDISTLPERYVGMNACADIHISGDGRYLYGSNRGHDSIVVYAIDQATGRLTLQEHASTRGAHPRSFALSPDGRFLLAANRDSSSVVTFNRNEKTGGLTPAGPVLKLPKPVCITFLA